MKLFKMLFGRNVSMDTLRMAMDRREWAQALVIGGQLQGAARTPDEVLELERLLMTAGDSLAELNLQEGEAFLRLGDQGRATEHFGLALEQARNETLRERAAAALQGGGEGPRPAMPASPPAASSCSGCSPGAAPGDREPAPDEDLDPQTRLDLILASYPPPLAERYQQAPDPLRQAFLLAHAGQPQTAMECLEQVSPEQRDELFHFERGTLLGRMGDIAKACAALELTAKSPLRLYALEALIGLQMAAGQNAEAEQRVLALLAGGEAPAFCHSRLAFLRAAQGDAENALEHGRQALALGVADTELLLLLATILEKGGALAEAEHLLSRLPGGGGCGGGGVGVHLAEFWTRHGMHFDRSLEAFKAAARSEPGNPRWPLRVAQTYLRRGWKKEGVALLERVLTIPELDDTLYREGKELLEAHRG